MKLYMIGPNHISNIFMYSLYIVTYMKLGPNDIYFSMQVVTNTSHHLISRNETKIIVKFSLFFSVKDLLNIFIKKL